MKFTLKKRINSKGEFPIVLRVRREGKIIELNTGQSIKAAEWNVKKGMPKNEGIYLHTFLATLISTYKTRLGFDKINNIKSTAESAKHIYKDLIGEVKPTMNEQIEQNKSKQKETFWHSFDNIINNKTLSPGYRRGVGTVKRNLKAFGMKELDLKSINQYIHYCITPRPKSKDCDEMVSKSNSTIRKEIQIIKRVWSQWNYNYKSRIPFKDIQRQLKVPKVDNVVFLLPNELEALEQMKPSPALDSYLLRCYTGIRQSEAVELDLEMVIDEQQRIHIQKTDQIRTIPINHKARNILSRYEGKAPVVTQQHENRMIKIVAKEAGLDRPYEVYSKSGSTINKEVKPLYDVLSSHSARRTFANRVYELSDKNIAIVSKLLGHTDVKTTMKYLGINPEVKVDFNMI